MKHKRYYYQNQLISNSTITISGDEFHHLKNVMRTQVGDTIELFCGDGNIYVGNVKSISKHDAQVLVENNYASECEPKLILDVYQALVKGDKLSLIMQKITELGASKLQLFWSKFCDVKPTTNKPERLETISISACKQCGRSTPVKLGPQILTIKDIASLVHKYDRFFVFYESEDNLLFKNELTKLLQFKPQKIAILVGAEGGLDAGEITELKNAGAIVVSLGKRILRTETAAIAGTAAIMQILD